MRILFITHYFQPEPNFFFGLPFAKELARRGHEVQVLTGFPNYPGGNVYEGYRVKFLKKEMMEGIPVYRFPLYPSHDRSSLKRFLCYSTLSCSMAAIAPWVIQPADVAYVVQGPATLGLPATILKWLRRIPFIYNIQDIWPDSLLSTGMFENSLGMKMLHRWCNFVYRRASKITVISPGMKKRLIERGVPEEKIEVIYNWCDDSLVCRTDRDKKLSSELGFSGKFNVVFAGNMGKAQALEAAIHAAKLLQPKYPNIQLVFIGSGVEVENLKNLSDSLEVNNTLFLPRKPIHEIGPILRQSDVLFVHLRKDPLFRITVPSKTQAYLSMGRPILIGVEGDAADLVEEACAGISCEPGSPQSIASGIESLYHMPKEDRQKMGKAGADFYDSQLSFSNAVNHYENMMGQIL